MDCYISFLLLLNSVMFPSSFCQGYGSLLIDSLLKSYKPIILPTTDAPINCSVELKLNQILQVNEKRQALTLNIVLSIDWEDTRLSWEPKDFGNISNIRLPVSSIWKPDIHLYNSAKGNHEFKQDFESGLTSISSTGEVSYIISLIVTVTCSMDVTWFPFDKQACVLYFGSWNYDGSFIELQNPEEVDLTEYVENGEWELTNTTASLGEYIYTTSPNPYYTADFTIYIKRRSFYYFFSLVFPCGLMGFLALMSFTLPPEAKEKLTLGVTVLFSLITFLNMISATVPANSNGIPLLGTYFCCVMLTIAMSVVSTVVVSVNERRLESELPEVTGCMKSVFILLLPKLLRVAQVDYGSHHVRGILQRIRKVENKDEHHKNGNNVALEESFLKSQDDIRREWKLVAIVVDRLCFLISLIVSIIAGVILACHSAK